jgi:RND family efflux transporter MFP subunit
METLKDVEHTTLIAGIVVALLVSACNSRSPEVSPSGVGNDNTEAAVVNLSPTQQQAAGIVTELLTPRALEVALRAPGEVKLNAYSTYQVTPRIGAQVVQRRARLGDRVEVGQPLVTLSSVEMAEAQGNLIVTEREWARVRELGREIVAERRYIEAEVAAQQARARVLAYGMLAEQIETLTRATDASSADGSFTLLSPATGTVVRDDFVVGEAIEPGRMMFEIADESTLWVEARLPARDAGTVRVGSPARVGIADRWIDGRVVQAYHALDENTRTLPVRVEVPNPNDDLHPGLFVDVLILDEDGEDVLAVPETAVLRAADGDQQLFVATSENTFEAVEIAVNRTVSGYAVIDGIAPGTRIVTQGGFFLQSELAKDGFDVHQH